MTFYWNRQQSEGLPASLADFSANDYFRARMRHWLWGAYEGYTIAVEKLAIEMAASPDGAMALKLIDIFCSFKLSTVSEAFSFQVAGGKSSSPCKQGRRQSSCA
jgi:hypothetical protein